MKKHNSFLRGLDTVFRAINSVHPYLLVVVVLCAHFLSMVPSGNEEAYFPLAKQFVNPDWMPHSFVFNEWAGTRVLYQYIAGFLLQFMSFEQLSFWGRLVIFLVSAYPLTRLFKLFRFSNVTLLIILELFLIRQAWIGGESIFGSIEPKSFAYIFVLFSLLFLFQKQYVKSILLAVGASYFHILVGGWYAVFALIFILMYERTIVKPIQLGLLYSAAMAPFLYFLSTHIIESGDMINGVNIDWVYVFYRNIHHCAPLSRTDAMSVVVPSVVQLFVCSGLIVFFMRKKSDIVSDKLFWANLVLFAMIWCAIIISLLNTSGSISKYYLFRISSVAALLFNVYVFWWTLRYYPAFARKAGYVLFFLVFIPSLIGRTSSNIRKNYLKGPDQAYLELIEQVKSHTELSDVFIEQVRLPLSFMRLTERESFVVKKLDPGGGAKIYEWYIRMEDLLKNRKDIQHLEHIKSHYKVDYLISQEAISRDDLELAYRNNKYFLYRIL